MSASAPDTVDEKGEGERKGGPKTWEWGREPVVEGRGVASDG